MRRLLIVSVLVFLPSVAAEATHLGEGYMVPVVTRNPGPAGANWRTELCITSAADYLLTVRVKLHQKPFVDHKEYELNPRETLCSDDFLFEWFGLPRWQGLLTVVVVEDEMIGNYVRDVAIKAKVYNVTANGTYGLSVPAFPLGHAYDDIMDRRRRFFASGIQHWGTAGIDGSRTSVGVAALPGFPGSMIQLSVLDNTGIVVWTKDIQPDGSSQVQFSLPKNLVVLDGSLRVRLSDPNPRHCVFPYFTVTDNETGDGYLVPAGVLSTPKEIGSGTAGNSRPSF